MHDSRSKRYKGKKVLILGLGRYPQGSGSSAARFFARQGAKVVVTDAKGAADLAESVRRLKGLGIEFVLGRHRLSDVDRADLVVRNPGVRNDSPLVLRAKKKGVPVTSDILVFMRDTPATVVGVTGTRGKSTTSALIAAMIAASKKRVWLGGNIKVSPLTFADKVKAGDIVVLELSSWMLEPFPEHHLSPKVAVMTNLMRDHLNTYPSMEAYGRAKAGIFASQGADGIAILSHDDPWTRKYGRAVPGRRVWTSMKPVAEANAVFVRGGSIVAREAGRETEVAKTDSVLIRGEHNLANALSAVAAARAVGVPFGAIRKALKTFEGLPDRMQTVREFLGVSYMNDSTATTPDATIAALRTLPPRKTVLISGGADKELEFKGLARAIDRLAKAYVLLPGNATEKLVAELGKRNRKTGPVIVGSMREAVAVAAGLADRGDTVLLSPGAASFGLFENEDDRSKKFVEEVKRLR